MRCARQACGGSGRGQGAVTAHGGCPASVFSAGPENPEVCAAREVILVGFSRENEVHPKSGGLYTKEMSWPNTYIRQSLVGFPQLSINRPTSGLGLVG